MVEKYLNFAEELKNDDRKRFTVSNEEIFQEIRH
jgi:hypothetical protein